MPHVYNDDHNTESACPDHNHYPRVNEVVPPGKILRHTCPACGSVTERRGPPLQTAKLTLTKLLIEAAGMSTLQSNIIPYVHKIEVTKECNFIGTLRQSAACSFVGLWATGVFPPEAQFTLRNDWSDRQLTSEPITWNALSSGTWYLPSPLLIPPNGTLSLTASRAGELILHGVRIYRRPRSDETPDEEKRNTATYVQRISKYVDMLRTLGAIIDPTKLD